MLGYAGKEGIVRHQALHTSSGQAMVIAGKVNFFVAAEPYKERFRIVLALI